MGVTFMSKKSIYEVSQLLKVDSDTQALCQTLDNKGFTLEANINLVRIMFDGTSVAEVSIGYAAWLKALKGDCGSAVLSLIAKQFKAIVLQAGNESVLKGVVMGDEAGIIQVETVVGPDGTTAYKIVESQFGTKPSLVDFVDPNAKIKPVESKPGVAFLTDTPIKLSEATKLLQPVNGTDASSKYFVIAIADGLRVALRVKNNNMISLRCEGEKLEAYKQRLESVGLNAASPKHISMHLDCGSKEMVRKTVGSVLFASDIQFTDVYTDIDVLIGKGA